MDSASHSDADATQCSQLTETMARKYAQKHTLFVTFTNAASSAFAANWALQLSAIKLSGLVGVVERLPSAHALSIKDAGSGLFCGSGRYMRRNGQAGRWAEVAPLLRFGLNVLISDSDIVWFRDPRPYFREVRRAHPHVDFLLCMDRAFNGYETRRLLRERWMAAGARDAAALSSDLDLEDGVGGQIPSYNIGILMLYAHAAANISVMIDVLWMRAVQTPEYDKRTGKKQPMKGGMSSWDQGPINTMVLRGNKHPKDWSLVLIDRPLPPPGDEYASLNRRWSGPRVRLGMGVLPMLQFATAYTYFIQAGLRSFAGAKPYSLHAIYSHGGGATHKIALMREAQGWHDPPSYYNDEHRRYLTYDSTPPERALRLGGFEVILSQLRRFESALKLAHLANRTLILPKLRCGNAAMAYPCYAWYHRATTSGGFRHERVPMPEYCPSYYWLNHGLAHEMKLQIREHSFLTNPRTPAEVAKSTSILHIGASTTAPSSSSSSSSAATVPAHAGLTKLAHAFKSLKDARVVHVPELDGLTLAENGKGAANGHASMLLSLPKHRSPLGSGLDAVSPIASGFWCTACVTTRRGGVLQEINASAARELEKFCRVEARGALGYPESRQSCCGLVNGKGHPQGCPLCERHGDSGKKKPWNASRLSWHVAQWLPVWANLPEPDGESVEEQRRWRCLHPLCTGADPVKYP